MCLRDDVDPALEFSDPSRRRLLREAVTRCHVQDLTLATPERIRNVTGFVPASSLRRRPEEPKLQEESESHSGP